MPTKPGYAGKEMRPAPIDTETSSTNAKTTSPLFPQASGSVRQGTRGKQGMNEGITKEELIQRHMQLQEQFDALQPLNLKLLKDVDKKKKSYMRREIAYKSQISHLKMVLEKTVLCHGSSESDLPATKQMHSEILNNIDEMQARRDRAIEEHEKMLLRQFRSNIVEVEDRLKKEQSKESDIAGVPRVWIERTAQLSKDVDKNREQAMRLDRINDVLNQKLEKYKHECKMQEEDREFLVRQLVAIKKENARLRREIEKIKSGAKLKTLQDTQSAPQSTLGPKHGKVSQLRDSVTAASSRPGTISSYGTVSAVKIDSGAELQRYNEVYERLRKLLETERRHTREAKAAHMKLLTNRTELEGMLRECVDEMKEEAGISTKDADRDPTGHGLSKEDRERVLELLLSQEKAIAQLYGESFRSTAPSVTTMAVNAPGADKVKVKRDSERDLSAYADDLAETEEFFEDDD